MVSKNGDPFYFFIIFFNVRFCGAGWASFSQPVRWVWATKKDVVTSNITYCTLLMQFYRFSILWRNVLLKEGLWSHLSGYASGCKHRKLFVCFIYNIQWHCHRKHGNGISCYEAPSTCSLFLCVFYFNYLFFIYQLSWTVCSLAILVKLSCNIISPCVVVEECTKKSP